MRQISDLKGKRFGRYTVIDFDSFKYFKNGSRIAYWLCRCDCGTERSVCSSGLTSGKSNSCGCLSKEVASKTHSKYDGGSNNPLYRKWVKMKDRCYNPKNKSYIHYGARGIKICEDWLHSYDSFMKWALNNGYNKSLSIDRIDNNGNYEPNNCRWVDKKTQAKNKRTNKTVNYNGKDYVISELCEKFGVNYKKFHSRFFKLKWNIEDALFKP